MLLMVKYIYTKMVPYFNLCIYVCVAAQHRFNKYEADWGFTQYINHKELIEGTNDKPPFLVDDTVVLTAIVRLIKDPTGVLWHNFIK